MQDNDLISRAALVEDLSYCAPELFFDKDFLLHKIMRQSVIDAVPVVHGHWIYKKSGRAECSVCHHDFVGVYDLDNSDNFCRHCGAKMDGSEP